MSLPSAGTTPVAPALPFEPPSEASSDHPCSASASSLECSSALESTSSTPPTSVSDACSHTSEAAKLENITVALGTPPQRAPEPEPEPEQEHAEPHPQPETSDATATAPATDESPAAATASRPRRAARANPTYNLSKLSGTAIHGKRRANGDTVNEKRRRVTVSGADLLPAADSAWSLDQLDTPPPTRRATRQEGIASAGPVTRRSSTNVAKEGLGATATKISSLGKRGKKALDKAVSALPRELRRLQDTDEFAHIDDKPVYHTVWSNGKFVPVNAQASSELARKKSKVDAAPAKDAAAEEENNPADVEAITPAVKKKRVKKYLDKGLYAGQHLPDSYVVGLTHAEKKKLGQNPELRDLPKPNKTLPLPIYNGLRLLIKGRDYKLPFDVCNPLPPGQPKPDEWRKMTKNRFIGDSKEYWRKTPHLNDFQSKCVCKPEDGCAESCQNRIMLYECDEMNCNAGKEHCTNRAFASLAERRAGGGKYRVGVEVIKTADRGYGVRSNRCFEPNQIIMEYTGEIITEEECERRMREKYKNNACYYLMSFDQNMIIDATTGSITRFVNHSCRPNCRMVKWIVGGNPRMALFAGDRPIMTGEELTYDYKFDPFSAKNVQTCLCGEENCRGVLGPKPKSEGGGVNGGGAKDVGAVVRAGVKAGKRKLKEMLGDGEEGARKKKVRGKGLKGETGKAKAGKGPTKGTVKGKAKPAKASGKGKASPAKPRKGAAGPAKPVLKKTLAGRVRKTYGRAKSEVQAKAGRGSKISVSVEGTKKGTAKGSRVVSLSVKRSTKTQEPQTPKKAAPKQVASPRKQATPMKQVSPRTQTASPKKAGSIVAKVDDEAPGLRSPVSKSGRVRRLTEKAMGGEEGS